MLFVGLLAIAEWWNTIYTNLFFFVIAFPSIFEQGNLQIEIARATNGGYPSKEDNLLWLTWPKCWSPHEKNIQYPGEGITQPLLKIHSVSLFLNGHLQENAAKNSSLSGSIRSPETECNSCKMLQRIGHMVAEVFSFFLFTQFRALFDRKWIALFC